jgi:hypothetical protein
MGGHEPQDVLKVVRGVGVHLGRHAHLSEAEPGKFEQRIIPGDALLEQGMNGPERLSLCACFLGLALRESSSTSRSDKIHDTTLSPDFIV